MLIPNQSQIKTITDLREDTYGLLQSIQKMSTPTVIFHRNSPKAVLLSVFEYNRLMDLLEDFIDGEMALELENAKDRKEEYIPLAKVMKKYQVKV